MPFISFSVKSLCYSSCREKQGHGSRIQPRRERRRPKARATRGGRNAWTSSRPRAAALSRAASWSARNRCQRWRGVPAAGSCSRYVSAVRRSRTAIAMRGAQEGAVALAEISGGELRCATSLPCSLACFRFALRCLRHRLPGLVSPRTAGFRDRGTDSRNLARRACGAARRNHSACIRGYALGRQTSVCGVPSANSRLAAVAGRVACTVACDCLTESTWQPRSNGHTHRLFSLG